LPLIKEMVEAVQWQAQYRETQHVEVYSYGSLSL